MTKQEFIKGAIKNGYTGANCNGWAWIRENLTALDYIFQAENYRACNGMKYKCIPLLLENENMDFEAEQVLTTAWYLNNERQEKQEKKEHKEKMLQDGWLPLTKDLVQEAITLNKKIELNASYTNDWQTLKVNKILKPKCFNGTDYGLMELRAKTRGYRLSQFENAFVKLI